MLRVGCPVMAAIALWAAIPSLALAHPGDGWYALPDPGTRDISDAAGLLDGSIVVADQDGPARRLGAGGWEKIPGLRVTGLVATPDGGLIATDAERSAVVRWRPGWPRPERIAGGRTGFAGDGGPALSAAFNFNAGDPTTTSPAVFPDGTILVPDTFNNRVRRIDPAGIVTTAPLAGRHRLASPLSLAALPDGGYLVTEDREFGSRIRQVAADGGVSTRGGRLPDVEDVAALPDGTAVAAATWDLWWLPTSGRVQRLETADFAMRGRHCAENVGTDMTGGLLVTGCLRRVLYRPALPPARALVALRATRIGPRGVRAVLETTHGGVARLDVIARGRRVARATAPVRAGHAALARSVRLGDGWHRLQVQVTAADGQVSRDALWLLVADRLTKRRAIHLMGGRRQGLDIGIEWYLSGRCRSFGAKRVDCERRVWEEDGTFEGSDTCEDVVSVKLLRSGLGLYRTYRCGARNRASFRRFPRWTADEESPSITTRPDNSR
jgi:hypothetical protein